MSRPALDPALPTTQAELAGRIQHTLVASDVSRDRLLRHCDEAIEYGFNAAMVPAAWVALAAERLRGTGVLVATAVDFPPAAMSTTGKAAETVVVIEAGAQQIDVGTNVGLLLSGLFSAYRDDVAAVVDAAATVPVKAMLELPLLDKPLRERAAGLAVEAGVAWLKNASSGAVGVATPAQMTFLRERAPSHVGVKASGGITDYEQARSLLAAGADLLGTSNGVALITGCHADDRAASGY